METSKQLEIIPKQVEVLRMNVNSTLAATGRATVAVSKYADGLPLYRTEKELSRVGLDIQRTTLTNWMIKTDELLSSIYQALHQAFMKEPVIHSDETTASGSQRTQ
ncbi:MULTISPECIES: IS66 family transposase [Vibrio]|uniref:IS66 family transposase n=1 Tax=Vibrio TaxID=662 RepID=UPI00045F2B86|nr:IS66 family transposase [Vibrio sp. Vb2532]EKH9201849.1 transposase [Vibrio parahaemolyticus]MDW1766107.1 transposase [Vibrio sp. Vb2532]GAK19358.1 mobile element protein [Vibrio sp. JCM 19053]